MNKYEALMWCAKNVEKWGEHARCPEGWHRTWRHEHMLNGDPEFTYTTPETAVSKSEWQAARDEYLAKQAKEMDMRIDDTPIGDIDFSKAEAVKPTWNGEGLPPVGVEVAVDCKRQGLSGRGDVVAHYRDGVVLNTNGDFTPTLYWVTKFAIRPIRTEREKAIEALAYFIDNMSPHAKESSRGAAKATLNYIDAGKIPGYGKLEE